jgi:large subunit ribosomal protein L30
VPFQKTGRDNAYFTLPRIGKTNMSAPASRAASAAAAAVTRAAASAATKTATTTTTTTTTAAATAPRTAPSYFRITLHRSAIGLPERTRGVLAALGLHRRCQTVFHPAEPQFAGMIMKVKELVRVEEVERRLSAAELRAERTPDRGFWLERRAGAADTDGASGRA